MDRNVFNDVLMKISKAITFLSNELIPENIDREFNTIVMRFMKIKALPGVVFRSV